MPLPHDSFFSGSSSGNMPYFVGPKIALCVLIRKTPASISVTFSSQRPSKASDMMPISAHLMAMVTLRLLNRSAKKPPAMENRTNGNANTRRPAARASRAFPRQAHADDEEGDEPTSGRCR